MSFTPKCRPRGHRPQELPLEEDSVELARPGRFMSDRRQESQAKQHSQGSLRQFEIRFNPHRSDIHHTIKIICIVQNDAPKIPQRFLDELVICFDIGMGQLCRAA